MGSLLHGYGSRHTILQTDGELAVAIDTPNEVAPCAIVLRADDLEVSSQCTGVLADTLNDEGALVAQLMRHGLAVLSGVLVDDVLKFIVRTQRQYLVAVRDLHAGRCVTIVGGIKLIINVIVAVQCLVGHLFCRTQFDVLAPLCIERDDGSLLVGQVVDGIKRDIRAIAVACAVGLGVPFPQGMALVGKVTLVQLGLLAVGQRLPRHRARGGFVVLVELHVVGDGRPLGGEGYIRCCAYRCREVEQVTVGAVAVGVPAAEDVARAGFDGGLGDRQAVADFLAGGVGAAVVVDMEVYVGGHGL